MLCPYCNSKRLKVIDKRPTDSHEIRRRRECLRCKKRFTTYERIQNIELTIIKKDNRKEPFNKEKLKQGLIKALEKRPVTIEQIDAAVNAIESELRKLKSKEVTSRLLGEKVIKKLKQLDDIAYIRFVSVYKSFSDPKDFEKEIKELKKK
ncbi:MAG TPA: transcriptional regulator NrdR [Candidatus Nanoarchaeia archaeon]|nr:transcriptional regulator NrdR [Candidatus Nanoarchaeia archaeon]